ncbi:AGE family epimerase/isomerase [Aestuariirhabdus sp. LZHN29]|uniref:AGE family epimerase/isomerase n=1 Tax=Aestuariirhabdus sp. LZHN29 TaxID=3417462 RepID=UPI003CFB6B86
MTTSFSSPLGNAADRQLARIEHYLFGALLPMWREHGIDQQHGGFFERLNQQLQPQPVDTKRLLVQCRQIFVYSLAYATKGLQEDADAARQGFDFLCAHYLDRDQGGWFFSTHDNGRVKDATKDAYGHAFVLFACAHYYRAFKDETALSMAANTTAILLQKLRDPASGGFFEAADAHWNPRPAIRRQNPHMHLLEAFIALYQTEKGGQQGRYRQLANSILDLFERYFFDAESSTLGEFFDDNWRPHQERGHLIEPGHHYEWYWLLMDYDISRNSPARCAQAEALYRWAEVHGLDTQLGGIYNEVSRSGEPVDTSKRIWPVTECIKARAIRYQLQGEPQDLCNLYKQLDYLFAHYLQPDGRWHEYLQRDNQPHPYDLPGSTGYHLFLGLMEARRVLAGA